MSNGRVPAADASFLSDLKQCQDVHLLSYYLHSPTYRLYAHDIVKRLEFLAKTEHLAKLKIAIVLIENNIGIPLDPQRALALLREALSE